MPCPKCGSIDIISAGEYHIDRTSIPIKRLKCKECGAKFTLRSVMFHKQLPIQVRKKVLRLWKTRKYNTNKFDRYKKRTYSTRDIARMLNISKSYVWDVVKKR